MAIINKKMEITGSVGGYTYYKRKGSKEIIVRKKPGPLKQQTKDSPGYKKILNNERDFGGCSRFASKTRMAFGGLHAYSDYTLNNALITMGRNLMKMDTEMETGKRSLKLSEHKGMLAGFNFNLKYTFDNVLQFMPQWVLNRENLEAIVTIPTINSMYTLKNNLNKPYFRLVAVLGSVSDWMYNETTDNYVPSVVELNGFSVITTGEWHSTKCNLPEHTMTVKMPESRKEFLIDNVSLVLSMAVVFTGVDSKGQPDETVYQGSGKVMAVF